ncbi:MAG: tRNA (guanine(10)-N(2))-dimethyltransferase [Candidatus Micrarchaeota archaeon]|nr:tRNA (guanine(10)-N(2))-dimethyltransferase [Candidatus Micrarchaeota archaeon]
MRFAEEGGLKFRTERGVFYNPQMELCRDLCSLAVGAIEAEGLSALDAMCATGVRGIRYLKENGNVKEVVLADRSKKAILCARKNAALNGCGRACKAMRADACELLRETEFDFVELDPFGSPVPFLCDAVRCFERKKRGWLSITATDTAVLCGAERDACIRNYGAVPLNNEFCHENAVRILAGKAILASAPSSLAAIPIFSLSRRHYVKIIFEMKKGAADAVKTAKSIGFVSYCRNCCWRRFARVALEGGCPHCASRIEWGGPLYLGKLWDERLLGRMAKLNAARNYRLKKEIEKVLSLMLAESGVGAQGYYDLHEIAKRRKVPVSSIDEALAKLRQSGFCASRTHFCPTAVRTDAPHETVLEVLG